jgi:hypothetical protein
LVDHGVLGLIAMLVMAAAYPVYRRMFLDSMTFHGDRQALSLFFAILVGLWAIWKVRQLHGFAIAITTTGPQGKPQPFGLAGFRRGTAVVLLVSSLMAIFIGAAVSVVPGFLIDHAVNFDRGSYGYAFIASAPYWYTIVEFGGSAAVVLLACLILVILQGAVVVVRGLLWRIVEYGKGPVAAVTIVLTVIFGVLDLYLRLETPK